MALNVSGSTTTRTTPAAPPAPAAAPAGAAPATTTPASDAFTPAKPATSPVALTPPAPAEDAAAATPPKPEGVAFTDATVGDNDTDKFAFGRQDVPVIDQRRPQGLNDRYLNGNWNCGPAAIAMVARSLGPDATMTDSAGLTRKIADMDDATLVSELGKIAGTTQQNGTSFKGMRAAAAAIGVPADASELWWSKNGEAKPLGDDFVNGALQAGKPVIINGAIDLPGTGSKPLDHYLLITGKTQGGDFIVNDSWTAKQHIMSKDDLKEFLIDNSIHDGVAIAMG